MAKLVVFSGPNCSACKSLKTALAADLVPFEEVDVETDEGSRKAQQQRIRSLPTTLVLSETDEVIDRFTGYNGNILFEMKKAVR